MKTSNLYDYLSSSKFHFFKKLVLNTVKDKSILFGEQNQFIASDFGQYTNLIMITVFYNLLILQVIEGKLESFLGYYFKVLAAQRIMLTGNQGCRKSQYDIMEIQNNKILL